MGIYDREYYRGETRGSGWLTGLAPACKAIIVINILSFFAHHLNDRTTEFFDVYLAATTDGIFKSGYIWQLVTATFLHNDVMHIFWNMLFLWIVGREMESMYGTRDFVAFYLSAAAISTLGWAAVDAYRGQGGLMLGASGAVMAVVVVYALYYPRREVLLFFIIPVEMWVLVAVYVLYDAYQLWSGMGPRVAVASHLTGAAYGYVFKRFDLRWSRLNWRRMRRPRLRLVMPEPREPLSPRTPSGSSWSPDPATPARPTAAAVISEESLDAKLDEVLAKIAREGRGGLTDEENRILIEASKRARNRRSDRL